MGNEKHEPIVNRLDETARQIATALGETAPMRRLHIRRIVQTLGPDRVLQLLDQAHAREEHGGQLLRDGSRRCTPGGVFFRLVRDQTTPAERHRIWLWTCKGKPPVRPYCSDANR